MRLLVALTVLLSGVVQARGNESVAGGVADAVSETVYRSKSADGTTMFSDRRLSEADEVLQIEAPTQTDPQAVRAIVAEQLDVAQRLQAARLEREALRLKQHTLQIQRLQEQRRLAEAEARLREAERDRYARVWYPWRVPHRHRPWPERRPAAEAPPTPQKKARILFDD